MNAMRYGSSILCMILMLISGHAFSQKPASEKPTDDKIKNAAREIMAAASTCALITIDDEDRPRARTMDPFPPEEDFTVWLGTNAKSRKVSQISNDPRVTLYYLDSNSSGYVVIQGIARLVDDPKEKKKHWKAAWETFYPNKENYLLIKVTPESMEMISLPRGILSDPTTWQPPKVLFNSGRVN